MNYPKVGLMSIGLDAYWPQFKEMKPAIETYQADIEKMISKHAHVVSAGLVDNMEKSAAAGKLFKANDVQLVFCFCATYSVSSNLISAVRGAGCPVILLNLQPVASMDFEKVTEIGDWLGHFMTCSAVPEMVAVLIRNDIKCDIITGKLYNDQDVEEQIKQWCLAAAAKYKLENSKLGMLGQPYEGMTDLYIDRTNLKYRLGLDTEAIEHIELIDILNTVTEEQINKALAEIIDVFECSTVKKEVLIPAARVYVALKKLFEIHRLDALAYHYSGKVLKELEDVVGTTNIAFSILTSNGNPCCVEGDVKATIGSMILKSITGVSELSELYGMDIDSDVVLFGHSGSGDANVSNIKPLLKETSVFHGKTGKGFLTQFYIEKGPVTLVAITHNKNGEYKIICAEGECVEGPVFKLGDTNSRIKFDMGLKKFVNTWCMQGPTHHCVLTTGHCADVLKKTAVLLNCDLVEIK